MKAAIVEAFGFRRAGGEEGSYIPVGYAPDVYVVDWESEAPVISPYRSASGVPQALVAQAGEQTQRRLGQPPRSKSNIPKKLNPTDNIIPYHPAWMKLADRASSSISPYLAVHWPLDAVSDSFLPSCAALLIRALLSLLRKPENKDIRTVYLATGGQILNDFGLPPRREGEKETAAREGRLSALRTFMNAFGDGGLLEGYSLTGVRGLLGEVTDDDGVKLLDEISLDEIDSGILALLDSRMAEKADLLVTGTDRCGRPSSFVNHIIDNRTKLGDHRNVVATFG
ncbi:hypothetical protein FRB90_007952 [Tulasnella sp. 427]|nr:hypothetical protein FRB90_007952 [Tulasnella sp. 427]